MFHFINDIIQVSRYNKISVIKEEKVKYRVNNQKSLQGTKELSIDNAFNAYEKLKELLIKDGLYQDNIKNSFTNMVLSSLIHTWSDY